MSLLIFVGLKLILIWGLTSILETGSGCMCIHGWSSCDGWFKRNNLECSLCLHMHMSDVILKGRGQHIQIVKREPWQLLSIVPQSPAFPTVSRYILEQDYYFSSYCFLCLSHDWHSLHHWRRCESISVEHDLCCSWRLLSTRTARMTAPHLHSRVWQPISNSEVMTFTTIKTYTKTQPWTQTHGSTEVQ